jgi:putative tryptophan/tyrosine transport system substrate-binding protein
MLRRDFITLFGGAVAWPALSAAQERLTVGFLSSSTKEVSTRHIEAFADGLRKEGYAGIPIEFRWANGEYGRLPMLASELVNKRVKVIAAAGGVISAKAAMTATSAIPIVFVIGDDPSSPSLRLVASLNHPGGNATGASVISTGIATKRFQLLGQALSLGTGSAIGLLVNPGSVTTDKEIAGTKAAVAEFSALQSRGEFRLSSSPAPELTGAALVVFKASSQEDIGVAIAAAASRRIAALLVSADPYFTSQRELIVSLVSRHAIPAMYPWKEYVDVGGLMSYGADLTWGYRLIGTYAGRIIKGERPGDLPVQQADRIEFIVNQKIAKAFGIEIDPNVLVFANEVIQ